MTISMIRAISKKISLIALMALLTTPLSAWAIDLDDAKNQGLVGELTNGYLGNVTANPSNEIKQLIADINKKRKDVYLIKSKEAGVSLPIMEQSVGKRLIERAETGQYISNGQGSWKKK